MVHKWIRKVSKRIVSRRRKKGEGNQQSLYSTWAVDLMLRQDAGRFMLGKYLSDKKNAIEVKETIGNGCGKKCAISQFSDQNRQNAISRVSAVQNSARCPR